jgi:hypothetical protein
VGGDRPGGIIGTVQVVVSGAIANKHRNGGEAWVRLSWVRGLERLGCRVFFVEQIDPAVCVGEDGSPAPFERSANRAYFEAVMAEFGLSDRSALILGDGEQVAGADMADLEQIAGEADLLANISGHLRHERLLARFRRRAFVDLDPGFTQIWHHQGAKGLGLEGHDVYFTVGENIGREGCDIPTDDIAWLPLPPPVVLDQWPVTAGGDPTRFTTVGGWRGAFGRVEYDGRSLGLKVHEFRKVIELPTKVPFRFEIALDIYPGDDRDRESLEANGWHLVSPAKVVRGPAEFRRFVQSSGAEFSVAQGIYVDTNSGWFSDRSVRYLASGRPTLLQDTGFSDNYPVGEGLVAFRTVAEAAAGARRIAADYEGHRAAARALAEERFDSDKVLPRFLAEAGLGS